MISQPQTRKVHAFEIMTNNHRLSFEDSTMVLRLNKIEQLLRTSRNAKNSGEFIRVAATGTS